MPCFKPLKAFQRIVAQDGANGPFERLKHQKIIFDETKQDSDSVYRPLTLPCGRCIGCRLERSKVWALRCCHEASLHEANSFITLTFDPERYPKYWRDLDKQLFVDFMKRLRIQAKREFGVDKIRFFHCGEYGQPRIDPETGEILHQAHAHHHAIIFGFDFPDKELWSCRDGVRLYRSAFLEKLWPFGFSSVGNVTFESCAYVARYVTKKINGEMAEDWYGDKTPEYLTMSRMPGIARDWIEKFYTDVYPKDFITFNKGLKTLKLKPPRYYDKYFESIEPDLMEDLKNSRQEHIEEVIITPEWIENNTPERLNTREEIQLKRFAKLVRGLETAS